MNCRCSVMYAVWRGVMLLGGGGSLGEACSGEMDGSKQTSFLSFCPRKIIVCHAMHIQHHY